MNQFEAESQRAFEYVNGKPGNVAGWRAGLAELKAAQAAYLQYYGLMTPYEKATLARTVRELREKHRQAIEDGIVAEHTAAARNVMERQRVVQEVKRAIINDWEPARLTSEMQLARMQVQAAAQAGNLKELERLHQEAKQSQDKYKIRAVCEALQSAAIPPGTQDSHGNDMRMALGHSQRAAQADLENLRNPDELKVAYQFMSEAVEGLNQSVREMDRVSQCLSDLALMPDNPIAVPRETFFDKAAGRVSLDREGNFDFKE